MVNNESMVPNEEYVTLSVDIPYVLKDKLKFCSYKQKRPIKDVVREALEKYFLTHEE